MVRLEKHGDSAVRFIFTDSDHYLYKDGVVDVPVNSLSLVIDESEMVTFKKASTGDPFISFRLDKSNFSSRDELLTFYKENMVGAGGLSEEEVQEMIDAATSGMPSSEVVEQLRNDLNTLSGEVDTKVDTTTYESGQYATAQALNELQENKLDASAYTPTDLSEYWTSGQTQNAINAATSGIPSSQVVEQLRNDLNTLSGAVIDNEYTVSQAINSLNNRVTAVESGGTGGGITSGEVQTMIDESISGKADTTAVTAVNDALTAHTSNTTVHVTSAEKDAWNAKQDALSAGTGIEISGNVISATGGGGMDDDTQQLISTAFNDLNDRKADLTELSKYQKKGDYVKTSTLSDYMTNASFDEYATAKERIISGALNDLNDKFGGLRLVKISQAEYDALATKDSSTLYIISD